MYFAVTLSPKLKRVRVVPTGDLHYGNAYCDVRSFLRHRDFIKDTRDVYTILMGDLMESSIRSSKGDIFKQVGSPQDQRDWLIEQLLPIKHKILGMCTGNHENRVYNEVGVDLSKDIAEELGVPYRAEGLYLKVSFGSGNSYHDDKPFVYWSYNTHGYGGARTAAAKAVKVERTSTYVHADWYSMSHDHVVNVGNSVYLMPDPRTSLDKDTGFMTGKVTAHVKKLVKNNAFLKWGGYAETGGMSPSSLETPYVILSGVGKPKVRIES